MPETVLIQDMFPSTLPGCSGGAVSPLTSPHLRRVGTRGAGFQIQTFFLSTLDHLPTLRPWLNHFTSLP